MKTPDFYGEETRPPLPPELNNKLKIIRSVFAVQLKASEVVIKLVDEFNMLLKILYPPIVDKNGKLDVIAHVASIENDPEVNACHMEFMDVEEIVSSSVKSSDHEEAIVTLERLVHTMREIIEKRNML